MSNTSNAPLGSRDAAPAGFQGASLYPRALPRSRDIGRAGLLRRGVFAAVISSATLALGCDGDVIRHGNIDEAELQGSVGMGYDTEPDDDGVLTQTLAHINGVNPFGDARVLLTKDVPGLDHADVSGRALGSAALPSGFSEQQPFYFVFPDGVEPEEMYTSVWTTADGSRIEMRDDATDPQWIVGPSKVQYRFVTQPAPEGPFVQVEPESQDE